jgi:chromosomal replication initiator protein
MTPEHPDDDWARVQAELRAEVTDSIWNIWLEQLRFEGRDGDLLRVSAPDHARTWISDRFSRLIQICAAAALGAEVTVDIVAPGSQPITARGASAARPAEDKPKYTFDQFVIGDGNRLAHAAALAVAELPGQAYNPLFIYGPPGTGKTHLLHSIRQYVETYGAGLSVRYATAEEFTNEFITALQSGGIDTFKARYRLNDVLLIDDIQFLETKAKTETEFFHTFNALYDAGSQLVLASDRLPRDMRQLEDRLRERFESGLVTDITPPDLATRTTILRMRARQDRIPASEEVLHVIAERIDSNVRLLEGALIRVVAFQSLERCDLTPSVAAEVLDRMYPGARARRLTVDEIQELVCAEFEISRETLLSAERTARVAWARHVAMYLSREHTDHTLPAIGRAFGGRNHSTVLHACRSTAKRMQADPEAYQVINTLVARLQQPS